MQGREWPWFSGLRWWQKALAAAAFFIVAMAAFLLPRHAGIYWVVSMIAAILAVSLFTLNTWRLLTVAAAVSIVLTAILVLTEQAAPYGAAVVAGVAFALNVWGGWKSSPGLLRRSDRTGRHESPNSRSG